MVNKPIHDELHHGDGYDGLTDDQVDKIHRANDELPPLTPAQCDVIAAIFERRRGGDAG